ncbi:Arc family DNA-binding protein [Kitasatospora sp. NPDC058965]|uniref:Arc family DNA-binding protein n=1 Tax=Kitasatospora sp. NPDC058965 TaxID=3346682 RepID=UPI003680C2B8
MARTLIRWHRHRHDIIIRFALRLPDDLHQRLTVQATTDKRSINSEILHLLEVALNQVATSTPVRLDGETATPDPPPAFGRGYPHRGKPDSSPG